MNTDRVAGDALSDALVTDDTTRKVMDAFGPSAQRILRSRVREANGYYKPRPTPKADRDHVELAPIPALTDPARTLGHAPRPRKRRR